MKTGFVFDAAPEVNHNAVSLIKENSDMYIDSKHEMSDFVEHKLIIGENYDALKNLLVTYVDPSTNEGLINVIYIDPPYNTEMTRSDGNDYKDEVASNKFVYRDKYTRDGWLNLMNERLVLGKKLLSKDGLIFVSIDDNNQAYLKVLMDEIFNENNFVGSFVIDKTAQGANQSKTFKLQHEYLLCYAKDINEAKLDTNLPTKRDERKFKYEDELGFYAITNSFDSINSPLSRNKNRGYTVYYNQKTEDAIVRDEFDRDTETFGDYDQSLIDLNYTPIRPSIRNNVQYPWNWVSERFLNEYKQELEFRVNQAGELQIYHKNRFDGLVKDTTLKKFDTRKFGNQVLVDILGDKLFDYPKSIDMMKWVLSKHFDKDALVLDFFAGSGTTGHAVMELNEEDKGKRKFILVTNNENDIAKKITYERLYRVINGVGSQGEKIRWKYSKQTPSLLNNKVRVFEIDQYELTIDDTDTGVKLVEKAEKEFKLLNKNYSPKSKFDIYNELSSLNPIKKVK